MVILGVWIRATGDESPEDIGELLSLNLKNLHLKEKGHSEDSKVHILDRKNRWFERGVKETIYVKLEKPE